MRVLLDECVPRALRSDIPGHEVKTVAEAGWAGVKNGELLRLAAGAFDVLLGGTWQTLAQRPFGCRIILRLNR